MFKPIAIIIAITLAAVAPAAADGFVLIGNAKGAHGSLSKPDVKALFTGKQKTLGGNPVVIVVRPDGDAPFGAFVDDVFGISTKMLLSKIQQEVFKGEMTKPLKASSDDEVVQHVAASAGNLGVVSSQAAGHLPPTVVVLGIGH